MADTVTEETQEQTEDTSTEGEGEDTGSEEQEVLPLSEVNSREKKLRESYERKLKRAKKEQEKSAEKHETQINELKAQLEDLQKGQSADPVEEPEEAAEEKKQEDDLQKRLQLLEERSKRKEDQLQKQIQKIQEEADRKVQEAQSQAEERERKLRETEMERQLESAIAKVGVIDRKMAYRFFKPQVEWDELESQWAYKTESGDLVPIEEGVASECPPSLKSTSLKSGAGSHQTSPPAEKSSTDKQIEEKKKQIAELQKSYRGHHDDTKVTQLRNLKRELQALEAEKR